MSRSKHRAPCAVCDRLMPCPEGVKYPMHPACEEGTRYWEEEQERRYVASQLAYEDAEAVFDAGGL